MSSNPKIPRDCCMGHFSIRYCLGQEKEPEPTTILPRFCDSLREKMDTRSERLSKPHIGTRSKTAAVNSCGTSMDSAIEGDPHPNEHTISTSEEDKYPTIIVTPPKSPSTSSQRSLSSEGSTSEAEDENQPPCPLSAVARWRKATDEQHKLLDCWKYVFQRWIEDGSTVPENLGEDDHDRLRMMLTLWEAEFEKRGLTEKECAQFAKQQPPKRLANMPPPEDDIEEILEIMRMKKYYFGTGHPNSCV